MKEKSKKVVNWFIDWCSLIIILKKLGRAFGIDHMVWEICSSVAGEYRGRI